MLGLWAVHERLKIAKWWRQAVQGRPREQGRAGQARPRERHAKFEPPCHQPNS